MQAAFGSVDVTPPVGGSHGRLVINRRPTEGVIWPLSMRLALFAEGASRVAVLIVDISIFSKPSSQELREAVAAGAGLPPDCVLVAATHTHNGSAAILWHPEEAELKYLDELCAKARVLAADCASRLAPATLQGVLARVPGYSSNRRPIYRAPDGREQVGTHGPRSGEQFLRMESADEDALVAVLARDSQQAPLGGLVNFGCHPTCLYNVWLWSADYPGPLRETVEAALPGSTFLFANAPAGDLAPEKSAAENPQLSAIEFCRYLGTALGKHAVSALGQAPVLAGGAVRAASETLHLPQRRVTTAQLAAAKAYQAARAKGEHPTDFAQQVYGYEYHFYHRSEVVHDWLAEDLHGMWEWQKREGKRVPTEAIEVQVLAIGDLAIVGVPCELFSEFGRQIRAQSPFAQTIVIELANGWHGYVPSAEGLARGGYESCLAYQSRLAPDAGAQMTAAALRLLHRLHAT